MSKSLNNKPYKQTDNNPSWHEIETNILEYWKENNLFQQSIDNRPKTKNGQNNEFIFYDGPPFANGLPHYGHLLTGYIKDLYARFQTNIGKKVERKFGWDCHGLPAEMAAEKELGFSGKLAIEEYGVEKFNNHCKVSVMKYADKWKEYVEKQGRWVDFDASYKTMDKNFMESVLWAFKELHKKGLIYKAMRVMPYSWACQTPLSNFETRLDNSYRQRADKAVTVQFKLKEAPICAPKGDNIKEYRILAWTTTPWTLPSNLALAMSQDIKYVYIVKNNICYIIGKFALTKYAKELDIIENIKNPEYIKSLDGVNVKNLINAKYHPLFNYFENHANSFKILNADFVTEDSGTGIVHMAPGFGEDDQKICEDNDIEVICPVDNAGKFTEEVNDFKNMQVFEANDPIIIKLKNNNDWFKTEQYLHNYPHCWRTDTPLIYKAVPSWYVKVTAIKDRMVELNKQINWIPGHVKDGLFGKWIANARDWSISRNRFWGAPIPVWESDNPKYPRIDVYGSYEELEKDFGVKITDPHKPYIDELTRPNPDDPTGKSMMRRTGDVFDCWFESGSMPYGQAHYPFENKEWFENHFPADFIVEYTAQTRGWFYTLMVLSTALFDRPPFLNCICHGVILDSTGQKLSKRLNNYADPLELFRKYGSDALRTTMLSSSVVRGQELLIDKEGKMVFESIRLFIKPIWSAYHFFCLYANSDNISAKEDFTSNDVLDKYILSKLKISCQLIRSSLEDFDTQSAYKALEEFFEILNNWYIRRSRNRFWKTEHDQDKISAYNTLYSVLINIMKASASLIPFISEHIYLNLIGGNKANNDSDSAPSIHLTDFPKLEKIKIDNELVKTMDQITNICAASLSIRNNNNARVRQPLNSLTIITENNTTYKSFESLIKDEINVKNIEYISELSSYATKQLNLNFPLIGKRLPKEMKNIIKASKTGEWTYKDNILYIADNQLLEDEYSIILKPNKAEATAILDNNLGLVMLDLNITPELEKEGIARDLIRFIQQSRKDLDLHVADYINIEIISTNNLVVESAKNFINLIKEQTLAKNIIFSKDNSILPKNAITINDFCSSELNIIINKI